MQSPTQTKKIRIANSKNNIRNGRNNKNSPKGKINHSEEEMLKAVTRHCDKSDEPKGNGEAKAKQNGVRRSQDCQL